MPANMCYNLKNLYGDRTEQVPAIWNNGQWFGLVSLSFVRWKKKPMKNQNETPYTPRGRELYEKRSTKVSLKVRVQELMESGYARIMAGGSKNPIYNFEYYMNRCYAYNRDKGRCKVCGIRLNANEVETHHIEKVLPLDAVNAVKNLATLCVSCHHLVHAENLNDKQTEHLNEKQFKKLNKYRDII